LSNLYELIPATEGYHFFNATNDKYYVYLTTYSLLNPHQLHKEAYVNVYMMGFSCKRANPETKYRFDAKTKATTLFIFGEFLKQNKDGAFIYICDNNDGRARNRNITFAQWFNEVANNGYEKYQSYIQYGNYDWYSSIIIRKDNPQKQLYIEAYEYTLAQMLNGSADED
jgi:hypothetical protein